MENNFKILKNAEFGSTEIYFSDKPTKEVRDTLKGCGFRWHGVKKCWYGYADGESVRHMIEGAEGVEAMKANGAGRTEAEGIAEAITRGTEEFSKGGLPEHWRKVWRENGIKGVTVRNNRGGYSYHFTFTFRMLAGDVMPESDALPMLENEFRANPRFWGDWINDPDVADECRGNVYYTAFYDWDAEKKERFFKDAARRTYDKMVENGPGCVVHAWVFYLEREKMRREFPIFTEQFWDRLEVVAHSVACLNYDRSDSMTDYFDVGFYESWDFVAPKEGAKDDAEMAKKMHAVAEVFRAKEEAARKAEEAAQEAAREAERAEYVKRDGHAKEVIKEYAELFPGDSYHPHVVVQWSELGAMSEHALESAGGLNECGATVFSVEAFENITGDLDNYFKDMQGYFKLKFTYFDGDFEFTDRCDLGEGTGSYGSRMLQALEYIRKHANDADERVMLDGGAMVTRDEYGSHARRYLEQIPATFDDLNATIEA